MNLKPENYSSYEVIKALEMICRRLDKLEKCSHIDTNAIFEKHYFNNNYGEKNETIT